MLFAAVVIPPPQLKVAPPVVEDAVNVSEVVLQVKTTGADMPAFGTAIFCVTVVVAIVVHPFAGSVTVTA